MEITFRKQVARKGSGHEPGKRLALLLAELKAVPPYDDPLAELTVAFGTEPLTLAAVLDSYEIPETHANRVFGPTSRTEQVVKRCLNLPPFSIEGVSLGP